MKVYGMDKKACAGLWVVYTVNNKNKYFVGAYRTQEVAEKVANKYNGKVIYNG